MKKPLLLLYLILLILVASATLVFMVSQALFPRILVAQNLDLTSLVGEDWYGVYLNGQKAGYSVSSLNVDTSGSVRVAQEAHFKVNQAGHLQDMRVSEKRVYASDGGLSHIESAVEDGSGPPKKFEVDVKDGQLLFRADVGGSRTEETLSKPKETLQDALNHIRLIKDQPKIGAQLQYSRFEPMFKTEITGASRIVGMEKRVLNGVSTNVYQVNTEESFSGQKLDSVSFIAEDGTLLEDTMAGIFKMRREPKEVAQDVDYSNDVIVSNAAMVDKPIPDPRERQSLDLVLEGPIESSHLFNDERQQFVRRGDRFEFTAKRLSLEGFTPAMLPIDNADVQQWTKPSLFIQSDAPRLIAKAKEIVGDETNPYEASKKLCQWVYDNVHTTYTATLSNALEVLDTLKGDCTEHSVLFVGLARTAGIPAREVAGLVYVGGDRPGFYFHQWATVWVGKWIDVDPTFNQALADVTHIKLAEGDLLQQTHLIPVIGRIRVHVVDENENISP